MLAADPEVGMIAIDVEDDGKGLEPGNEARGFGVKGMRERAVRIGGSLTVTRGASSGTRVELVLERGSA